MSKMFDKKGVSDIFKWFAKLMKGIFNLILTIILIGVCIYIDARYIEPKLIWAKEETIITEKNVKKEDKPKVFR